MEKYQQARVKLANTQLSTLKSAAKNKAGKILRLCKKNFIEKELSHWLFLATRQTTKIRNVFANNIAITNDNIRVNKAGIFQQFNLVKLFVLG